MSAFKQSMGKLGVRAGLLATVSAAVLAVSGVGASSALALKAQCAGENIKGEGASLQGKAQSIWTSAGGFNGSATGHPTRCPTSPTVGYTASGSGAGLGAWGVNTGTLKEEDAFVGSDDAPNVAQLGEIKTTLGKKASTNVAVIPVTQTAIAVVVNLPENCTLTQITNEDLEAVFRGAKTKWSEVANTSGAGCAKTITRVVRFDGSGTTYQFKHYLSTIAGGSFCTEALGNRSWTQLQSNTKEGGVLPNTTWPDCGSEDPITTAGENGGGALVKKVNTTDSSIGYAALADAMNNKTAETTVLKVQDFVGEFGIEYAAPSATGSLANCSNVPYNKPKTEAGAEVASWEAAGTTANLDWSQVYGSDKNVGGGKYSICTLTWDLAATNSTGVFGEGRATTVRDYLKYVTTTGDGQTDITANWYRPLPSSAASNVQLAAEKAVLQIG